MNVSKETLKYLHLTKYTFYIIDPVVEFVVKLTLITIKRISESSKVKIGSIRC